MTAESKLTWR